MLTKHVSQEQKWFDQYDALSLYLDKHDNQYPSQYSKNIKEKKLGDWVKGQKKKKKKNQLLGDRIKYLEDLPNWEWAKDSKWHQDDEAAWHQDLKKVLAFIAKNDRLPSGSSKNAEEARLARWCYWQHKKNVEKTLEKDKVKLVKSIPYWFGGSPKAITSMEKIWEYKFELVLHFVEVHKHIPVSTSHDPDERVLGHWCAGQRQRYDVLPEDRFKKLESIPGWFWERDREAEWLTIYDQVLQFVKQHKRLPNRSRDGKLGQWCSNQRCAMRGSVRIKMTPERVAKLERIPGWYWLK